MVRYCRLFNVFKAFSCKIGDSHVFSCSGIKVSEGFPIISNLAVTTRITINYSRADFFLKWILKSKQCVKSTLRSKTNLSELFVIIFYFNVGWLCRWKIDIRRQFLKIGQNVQFWLQGTSVVCTYKKITA